MDINVRNMDNLYRTINTAFLTGLNSTKDERPHILVLGDVAFVLPSNGASTQYSWLGQIKGMTEWVGDRILESLKVNAIIVVNRKFEDSLKVDADNIRDDQYGQFARLGQSLGESADELPMDLVGEALIGNAKWADGNPFFCTGRVLGKASITNASTNALSKDNVETAITAIGSYQLHAGRPAKVRVVNLLVGASKLSLAKSICEAKNLANGASNTSTAMILTVKQCDEFVGDYADRWAITGVKAGIPPVAYQQREKPGNLTRMDKDGDYNVFLRDIYYYGVRARGEAFMTIPILAYMGGMDAAPAWNKALADALVVAD